MPDEPTPAASASRPASTKLKRKAGKPSRWARSFTELGAMLCPPRERKTLQRALRRTDLPAACKRKADGRYDVPAWQAWLDAVGTVGHTEEKAAAPEPVGIEAQLKAERLRGERLANEKVEIANNHARGISILKADAIRDVGNLFAQVKGDLLKLCDEVSPIIITKRDPAEARVYLRTEVAKVLSRLALPAVQALAATPKAPAPQTDDAARTTPAAAS